MVHDEKYKELDLDDILPQIGDFGKYQKLLLWLVCLPACFPCGFCAFNQLFMAKTPEHWCYVPQLNNLTIEQRKILSIPKVNGSFAKCLRFQQLPNSDDFDNFTEYSTEICLDGWEYDKSEVQSSIVIDFNLVCNEDIYPTLGLVALNLGGPIGVYMFGLLNDRIGRKKTFFLCLTTLEIGSILTATAQNFWWWAGSRIIVGLTVPAIYQIPFIISLELVGPNYRSFVTVLTCLFYTIGLMMLALIAYLVKNWVYLSLCTSLPFILYYFYWFFLPESPRWLLSKGKYKEALKILETLARINNKPLPNHYKEQIKERTAYKRTSSEDEALKRNPGWSDLCGTPNMRLKTTLITFNWFANEMVYVGLSYYGPSLGSNEYLSFFLSSAVEIPSYIVCWLIMDRWGRRWPLCFCMVVSGCCCVATVLVNDSAHTTLILFLVSKSTISASFLIIYPFAGELYPTQLRGFGIGTSAYIAGLGLIIIPFITHLGSEMLELPLVVMGIISVVGGLTSLRLPETLHHRLPQTVEEGEEFGRDFTFKDCMRCIPAKPPSSARSSYEDLEMAQVSLKEMNEETPLENRRISLKKLVKQQSTMDTQKDLDEMPQPTEGTSLFTTYAILIALLIALWILYAGIIV